MEKSYTNRTLTQKLGIKAGMSVLVINQPEDYHILLTNIPQPIDFLEIMYEQGTDTGKKYDFIHAFVASQERLEEVFPFLRTILKKTGMLWISWPKGHCDIRSNLNENIVRTIGLENGLVDIKIISINEGWSGLKFVYRLIDRA